MLVCATVGTYQVVLLSVERYGSEHLVPALLAN